MNDKDIDIAFVAPSPVDPRWLEMHARAEEAMEELARLALGSVLHVDVAPPLPVGRHTIVAL